MVLISKLELGYQAVSARRSLNLLFSEWANRGINYWTVQQRTLTLATDTSSYDLPTCVLDLLDVVIYDSADATRTDTIINGITISEYNQIPNKSDTGKPNQYMLDKGRQSGSNNIYKLFLWQNTRQRHIQTKLLVYESTGRYNCIK